MEDNRIQYGKRNGENIQEYFDNVKGIKKLIPTTKNIDDITMFFILDSFGFILDTYQEYKNDFTFSFNDVRVLKIPRRKKYNIADIIILIKNNIIDNTRLSTIRDIKESIDFIFNGYPQKEGVLDIEQIKTNFLSNTLDSNKSSNVPKDAFIDDYPTIDRESIKQIIKKKLL